MPTTTASPRAAVTLVAAALIAVAAGPVSAEGINPNPGDSGTPITGVNRTPTHLCQPGTMRFVSATRQLSLPGERYCTDADWNVRDVRAEGANLLWRVPFTNGYVDCNCTRVAGATTPPGPSTSDQPAPPPAGRDPLPPPLLPRAPPAKGFPREGSGASGRRPRVSTPPDP